MLKSSIHVQLPHNIPNQKYSFYHPQTVSQHPKNLFVIINPTSRNKRVFQTASGKPTQPIIILCTIRYFSSTPAKRYIFTSFSIVLTPTKLGWPLCWLFPSSPGPDRCVGGSGLQNSSPMASSFNDHVVRGYYTKAKQQLQSPTEEGYSPLYRDFAQ